MPVSLAVVKDYAKWSYGTLKRKSGLKDKELGWLSVGLPVKTRLYFPKKKMSLHFIGSKRISDK